MGTSRRSKLRRRVRGTTGLLALAVAGATALTSCATPDSGSQASTSNTTSVAAAPVVSSASSSAAAPLACGAPQLSQMSLRDKLAQLINVGVTDADDAARVVRNAHVGGIFIGSWTDKSLLSGGGLKRISAQSHTPLMVTVDQEGGRVSRLSSLGIDNPSARELAQTRTPEQTRTLAASVGAKLKNLGITVDLAPDADVSDEPDDDVIGDRSFSNDPATVARYASAFADGLRSAGVMPVFKHFPGHGHGSGDSHTQSVTTPPLASLQRSDLVPYRTLLTEPQPTGVMVGHLIVPGLTGPQTPASLSPHAVGMLRSGARYGGPPFNGVVFSDDLSGMAAITEKYGIDQAAVMAITAGSDVALWETTDKVPSVLDALQRAVSSKKISVERVDQSVVRVLRAKGVLHC